MERAREREEEAEAERKRGGKNQVRGRRGDEIVESILEDLWQKAFSKRL